MNTQLSKKVTGFLFALAFVGAACSNDKGDKTEKTDKKDLHYSSFAELSSQLKMLEAAAAAVDSLTVIDEAGHPVGGATVLFGASANDPFKGNSAISDADGTVSIPKDWTQSLSVSIQAPGYVTTTYSALDPVPQTLKISTEDGNKAFEVSGKTVDYQGLTQDGYLDFSLVIPALTEKNILNFDISSVVSNQNDTMSVAGNNFEIPSNISIPRQTESYFFDITFDKPGYRMPVRHVGDYKFVTAHGRFPMKKVVDEIRGGKTIFEVINYFEFLGGGQKDISLSASVTNQDISVNQFKFDKKVTVKAPSFDSQYEMMSISLSNQGGYLFPADLKRMKSARPQDLKFASTSADNYILSVLLNAGTAPHLQNVNLAASSTTIPLSPMLSFTQSAETTSSTSIPTSTVGPMSISYMKQDASNEVSFLPFVAAPKYQNQQLVLDVPAITPEISAVETFIVLSEVEKIKSGSSTVEKKTRLWELYQPGWIKTLDLPQVAVTLDPKKAHRWEVIFIGRSVTQPTSSFTHVTRNTLDF